MFGSPAAGTAVMTASPLAAIDLPLKVLIWQDDLGAVWASFVDADWLRLVSRQRGPGHRPSRGGRCSQALRGLSCAQAVPGTGPASLADGSARHLGRNPPGRAEGPARTSCLTRPGEQGRSAALCGSTV
jgi:hypothetical protein